ncbi:MAG: cytochrome c biogenesis protein, transmembrane region, cytochrome c-type biogenesis protein [Candidatus Gottesmanbacteria bacterium GW2011_GWA2_43_14]|uniref:Cytochrome c biogenesis protein, transmembrane region, cytochrome c-type biogenesis protein n=1 Tax=Candidatus Gottesmanbacteria bacterium GW2011_GWA2_43_14 TaxID=1618443 RepID=A0A0G1G9B8_9BACT|nr:MAG: cytochrome c biogenesis protein, transmembrane region, cytochrome c-type biogenesis protein [Candidatus Gottesmanbacteria bacterium GW2011_GWA2_43_14]
MRLTLIFASLFFFVTPVSVLAQVETAVNPAELAQCLASNNFTMYGRSGCSACAMEKEFFGSAFSQVPYVECDASDENRAICDSKGISAYPTWEDAGGSQYRGAIPLAKLAELSGCQAKPESQEKKVEFAVDIPKVSLPKVGIDGGGIVRVLSEAGIKYWGIFLAGLISFLAPCLIPLFPSYFSIITGYTFADLYGLDSFLVRKRVFLSAVFFSLGFAIIFTLLGATGSLVGLFINNNLPLLLKISGFLIMLLGLVQIGRIKIPALEFDYAWVVQRRLTRLGYFSATVAGVASALCWIPCIGPILASVLLLSSRSQTIAEGMLMLLIYSLGLSLPFLLGGLFFHRVFDFFHNHRSLLHRISQLAGLVLIAFGLVIFLGKYSMLLDLYYAKLGNLPLPQNLLKYNIPLIKGLQ